jgi:hypothetical protein
MFWNIWLFGFVWFWSFFFFFFFLNNGFGVFGYLDLYFVMFWSMWLFTCLDLYLDL